VPSLFVDVEMKEKGDMLVKMLRGRMKRFLKNRIQSEVKRSHRALTLAHKNLSVVAANMVLADHVKKNLNCLDGNHSLLTNASNKFLLCQTFPENEGDYLYFDMNLGEFVRSGKVTGRGFLKLHAEHETQPKKEPASSNFYFQCPSKAVSHSRSHQGEFEVLQMATTMGAVWHSKHLIATITYPTSSDLFKHVHIMSDLNMRNDKRWVGITVAFVN
jgi:hypothetical protein